MSENKAELKKCLDRIYERAKTKREELTEEDLRTYFIKTDILKHLGYKTIGEDIRLEKTIKAKRKRADVQCLDDYGSVILIVEFKKPADPTNLKEHFRQLWDRYVIPLKAKYGILTNGLKIIIYERRGINEHMLLEKSLADLETDDCEVFTPLEKPLYNMADFDDVKNYFESYKLPEEKIDLKKEISRELFYENFRLKADSLFGKLIQSTITYFKDQYNKDQFLTNAYQFWLKSYAKKPDKIPDNWKKLLDRAGLSTSKNDLFKFMFCLETAYALFTRLILAKACEDYNFPQANITKIIERYLSDYYKRGDIPLAAWGIAIMKLMENMRDNLVESIFEEDIFYWWTTEFMSMKDWRPGDLFTRKVNTIVLEFCKSLAEIIFRLSKFNFSEIAGDPIGDLYQQYFDKDTRKALGEFYTPREVVEYIVENVGYKGQFITDKRFIDPSCGSGTFLVEALSRYLKVAKSKEDKTDRLYWSRVLKKLCYEFRITGLDIHPFACIMSQIHYMLVLIPFYKKAMDEDKQFLLKRIPIFRTDSLWDITKEKIETWFFGEIGTENVILKLTLPIKVNGEFLEIKIKMPRTEEVMKKTDLVNTTQYFCALQALFDTVKELAREETYEIDVDLLEKRFKDYLEDKNWNVLVNFFSSYANEILKSIDGLKHKFGDGRLVKSIEDIILSGLIKTPKYVRYDYVVGNPPYVNIRMIDNKQKAHYEQVYETAKGLYDLYCLFIEKSFNLLLPDGKFGYITSNQFILTDYGKYLREILLNSKNGELCKLEQIIDFRDSSVFKDVVNYPCILIMKKTTDKNEMQSNQIKCVRVAKPMDEILNDILENLGESELFTESYDLFEYPQPELNDDIWTLMPKNEKKVFKHLDKVKDKDFGKITENIFVGTQTSLDDVYLVFITQELENGLVKIRPKGEDKEYVIEKKILKPLLKGKDVTKWCLRWSKHWLVFPYREKNKTELLSEQELKKDFPYAWKYLLAHRNKIEDRENGKMKGSKDWYGFIYPKNHDKFEQIKLMSQLLSTKNRFAFDGEGKYYFIAVGGDCISLIDEYKDLKHYMYTQGLLNSSVLEFYLKHISPVHEGGFYLYIKQYLSRLPFMKYNGKSKPTKSIINNVEKILSIHKIKAKIDEFPNYYIEEPIKQGKEFNEFKYTFKANHTILKPKVTKNLDEVGYNVEIARKEDPIPTETTEKAEYLRLALYGSTAKKEERITILLPKQNDVVKDVIKKYKDDLETLEERSISDIEKEIDDLVYQLYHLKNKDIGILESYNEKY